MLKLSNIKKEYQVGNLKTEALRGVNLEFRENEFVAILGPSGCGKTTLLNIIGGLDRYSEGELYIEGRATRHFKDYDWDLYRNNRVGFVFQTYNLIGHQTVLSNVEIALTLIGVSKEERTKRALSALASVGLSDQAHKKPNQLSGGQMQRVAIARAIINNPCILLADEPTGALDSESSVQVMDILKELSKDRLVIVVTHNPELAEKYATRTIRLSDGEVLSDSDPFETEFTPQPDPPVEKNFFKRIRNFFTGFYARIKGRVENEKRTRHTSMKYSSALKLSFNNLITKKMRTFLTSFAGSIGIIGIALVLALSTGFSAFIKQTEENSLSKYPLVLENVNMDVTSIMSMLAKSSGSREERPKAQEVYVGKTLGNLLKNINNVFSQNDLAAFKKYLDQNLTEDMGSVKYDYGTRVNIFSNNYGDGEQVPYVQINPFQEAMEAMFASDPRFIGFFQGMIEQVQGIAQDISTWDELIANQKLLNMQYELLGSSKWPTRYDEIVLVVDKYNQIEDYSLFTLGLFNPTDVLKMLNGSKDIVDKVFKFEDLIGMEYRVMANSDYYYLDASNVWNKKTLTSLDDEYIVQHSIPVKVSGIVRLRSGVEQGVINGVAGYTPELVKHLIDRVNSSEAVEMQTKYSGKGEPAVSILGATQVIEDGEKKLIGYSEDEIDPKTVLKGMGVADIDEPDRIMLYVPSFEAKDKMIELIEDFNDTRAPGEKGVKYTDWLGMLMSSINTISDTVKWVLIAFSAISLVVSSIMIGIITYISVLERTKEIGILRSVGARKKDITRIFNAETLMVGFASGIIGIIITMLLTLPINAIAKSMFEIEKIAGLNWYSAVILIAISMLLTLISGFIPSRMAAKKDPVTALRSE